MFQELLERTEWGSDLPSVENNLQEHNKIHSAVEELMSGLQEARSYEVSTHTHTHHSYTDTHISCFIPNDSVLSSPSG